MTTSQKTDAANEAMLARNLARVEELSQRLVAALSKQRPTPPSLEGPSPDLYAKAGAAYISEWLANPAKIMENQIALWGKSLQHYIQAQQALASGKLVPPEDDTPPDRRFQNPLWQTHPYFNYVKQQYLLTANAIEKTLEELEGLDDSDRQRLSFFTKQIINLMAPTNFLATNPDALERAVETEGQSLVDGLENLVRDVEANGGDLLVTLADRDAFKVGSNLATTEGAVVFRNRLFELIQYAPKTKTVYEKPVLLFPPWINKFYVLDLKPQNSLIRWIVEQGYTLFVVSWVNPDASYADVGLETYIEEGYLTALNEVKNICGVDQLNAVGYCIAGTTLALTLALMEKRGEASIGSATFFTTLTDFSDPGEFGVFLTDDFVDGIEAEARREGVLRSYYMARTFSYLRANDLIYTPAIRSYMLGEAPPAFDLLYWNGDSTNLPARMTVEYLRWLCQQNRFCENGVEILGETIEIGDVKVPVCAIACETDHIAAWRTSFDGVRKFGSRSKEFILSESGHIAGIVNPPSKDKYGYYVSDAPMSGSETWLKQAKHTNGSWWPEWEKWLRCRSGKQIPARKPGEGGTPVLCPAPGTYVLNEKYSDRS